MAVAPGLLRRHRPVRVEAARSPTTATCSGARRETLYIGVHAPVPGGQEAGDRPTGAGRDVQACWTWPGCEGQVLPVDVYSTCDEVELLLNGKSLGKKVLTEEDRLIATFAVPYAAGELTAIGYRVGGRWQSIRW